MASSKDKEALRKIQQVDLNNLQIPTSVNDIIKEATSNFKGNLTTLESAIGAIFIGQIYGWRVLRMMHGSNTYVNYEKLLNVKFKDICPDKGPLSQRSVGLAIADKLGGFWKVVTGKVPGRSPIVN
jgi:hypothetical protein